MKKNILTLSLVLLAIGSYAQLEYIGLSEQSLSHTNPILRLKGDTIYTPTRNGLFKKSIWSDGTDWIQAGFPGMTINDYAIHGDTIICAVDSTEGNTIFISTDNGISHYNSTNGYGSTGIDYMPAQRVAIHPSDPDVLLAMGSAVIARSTDFGASWEPIYLDWGYINYQTTVLQYHPLDPERIYSGGELPLFDSFLTYSMDDGENWETSASEINQAVNTLTFHPSEADTMLIGKEGKIELSDNGGATWQNVYDTPSYEYIYSIVYNEENPNELYAAGAINGTNDSIRIFRSLDGGMNWEDWYAAYLPTANGIMSMVMKNGALFILTRTAGVYRFGDPVSFVAQIEKPSMLVYPNPAQRELLIRIDEAGKQTILIYDQLGVLVQSHTFSGVSMRLDVSALASGLYILQLQGAGNQVLQFIKE